MTRYLTPSHLVALDARLSDRDRQIVVSVDRLRLASGQQLRRLHFPHRAGNAPGSQARLARGALARLTRLRLVRRLERRIGGVAQGSDGFIYEVGPAGERLLAYWQNQGLARTRKQHQPSDRFTAHRLATSDAYVSLVEATRNGDAELLDWQPEPACWRTWPGPLGHPVTLKPDGYLELAARPTGESAGSVALLWFLEVDRGTVNRQAITRQANAYLAYWRSGQATVMPRVLWICPTPERAKRLLRWLDVTAPPPGLFEVTTDADAAAVLLDDPDGGRS